MKAVDTNQKKRLSLLLLSAGLMLGVCAGSAPAQDYYDDYGEEEPYESSEMFFYDYADEDGPSAPPEPVYSGNGASQLIIISPPEDAWQDPRIKIEKQPPIRGHQPTTPAKRHDPAPKRAKPADAEANSEKITPADRPVGSHDRAPKENTPVVVPIRIPVRADNHPPKPDLVSAPAPVVKSPPEITPKPEKTALSSHHSDVVHPLNIAPPDKTSAKARTPSSASSKTQPTQSFSSSTHSQPSSTSPSQIPTHPLPQADRDFSHNHHQQDKADAMADSSFQPPAAVPDSLSAAEQASSHPAAKNAGLDYSHKPAVTKSEKLWVKEFVATPTAGKPVLDPSGKTVHFYSDPAPLVMEPPPDPNYDPDFADFEKSRVMPVVNAPDGLYGFSFEGEGVQIAASHTYDGVQIRAGDIVALNMLITNNSTLKRVFAESVNGPEGLKGVHEIASFEINPGDTVTRRVSLHLDSSMAAGEHRVSYRVTCRTSPKIGGELEFGFAIRALPRLAFEIASATPLIENAPFKATGRILNTGNTGLNIQLSLKGRQKNLQVTPSRISLPAGGHAFVEIEGTTPARQHPLDDIFNFDLTAVSDKVSGNLQLLNEPVKLRIASKQ